MRSVGGVRYLTRTDSTRQQLSFIMSMGGGRHFLVIGSGEHMVCDGQILCVKHRTWDSKLPVMVDHQLMNRCFAQSTA